MLATVTAGLQSLFSVERTMMMTDAQSLALVAELLRVDGRLEAGLAQLVARLDDDEVAWRAHGTSTATWLAGAVNLTQRESSKLIASGRQLERFGVVAEAAQRGAVLPGQCAAITSVLSDLPDTLPQPVLVEAENTMVNLAGQHTSTELRRLSRHLLEVLAPETADELEADRLERQHRQAMRNRFLNLTPDHQGSVLIRGSLPATEAEPFVRLIDAYVAAQRRGLERLDPSLAPPTAGMLRADALLAMVQQHNAQAVAPPHGGDRPRAVVTVSYEVLQALAAGCGALAGRIAASDQPVPPATLRQLLCDCDVMPAVMGGPSLVLDVGRSQRLVTSAIRAALEVRDRGCVFPGCEKPPQASHAHHIVPWWAGGETALANLVLLCPHHHGIVEPGRDPTADRWQVRLRADSVAEVIPPLRVDPEQQPRRHARYLTRQPAA